MMIKKLVCRDLLIFELFKVRMFTSKESNCASFFFALPFKILKPNISLRLNRVSEDFGTRSEAKGNPHKLFPVKE